MELYCTYIDTDKFSEMVDFYEKILNTKCVIYTENRWVEFNIGNKIAIYNRKYDEEIMKNENDLSRFNQAYIDYFNRKRDKSCNNVMILNIYSNNLKSDYERIKKLGIGNISDIMFVKTKQGPYYYFNVYDLEGNTIEIFGNSYE